MKRNTYYVYQMDCPNCGRFRYPSAHKNLSGVLCPTCGVTAWKARVLSDATGATTAYAERALDRSALGLARTQLTQAKAEYLEAKQISARALEMAQQFTQLAMRTGDPEAIREAIKAAQLAEDACYREMGAKYRMNSAQRALDRFQRIVKA